MRRRLLALALLLCPLAGHAEAILRPKVVVVAMFEIGADTGDRPGELQLWIEREKLDRVMPLPAAGHAVRTNADGSIVAVLTGVGNINAASTIMALGLDPRFDLRQSYWLIAGIAGVDPADASVGSAAWAKFVVDGDLAHELDAREIPADWPTGRVPLGKRAPYATPRLPDIHGHVFALNAALVDWAYSLTRDTPLPDSPALRQLRSRYTQHPAAQRPPTVLIGDAMATSTFWHGTRMNEWANEWVRYYTDGRGNYVMTAMEDSGTLRALQKIGAAGLADPQRVLVLRTASNYDSPWPGATSVESFKGEEPGQLSGLQPAVEAAHAVGSRVVHALIDGWADFQNTPPRPR